MKTLAITSPLTHSPTVKELQQILTARKWYSDTVDGVYGTLTGQGVYRAKYWLGYPQRSLDQKCGDALWSYLHGKRPSLAMRTRTKQRNRRPTTPLRQKALAWLSQHLGDKESPPNSNHIAWASEWYGVIGPWCAMAVTRAYVQVGSKTFKRGSHYAYVPYIVADARAGRNNLTITRSPQPGDLVCFDWERNGVADHIGLFEKWTRPQVEFTAVEGNTATGNDSNGGSVMRRTRNISQVQAFVHVGR